MRLTFEEGTLLLRDSVDDDAVPPAFVWDARVDMWRAQALHYRESLAHLNNNGTVCRNTAPRYQRLRLQAQDQPSPHPHQSEALEGWRQHQCRGLVVLPTGSGKSYVGIQAIQHIGRSTLVIAPTIDLMNQWHDLLHHSFARPIGLLGGGYHEIEDITVSTYDSAYMHMERYGNRFGLVVFDEAHHLPGPMYSHAAEMCLAPYRLGLTATPERADGRHVLLATLIGPTAYEKGIRDLAGEYLADYRVERRYVEMVAEERARYETAHSEYRAFLDAKGIRMGSLKGWQRFVQESARSSEGRRAMLAYRLHRKIALGTQAKLHHLEEIFKAHPRDRIIVFTNDNETVHEISRLFLIPSITHLTRTRERREILQRFNEGQYLALATSKVLNEGVNIPEAVVGVVLSGSGTIREHVQRLGRILRRRQGKEAVLYEVISKNTLEDNISKRRRRHSAYEDQEPKD
jgi:superfamily II DNA or RNA helicase